MNPQIEELRAEQEQIQQEIEQLEHQQVLIENKISYFKGADRRKRSHRLITRGAAVECLLAAPGRGMRAYRVRGAVIALRRRDARQVTVEDGRHE